ncbi:hypothetical protein MTES_2121 [Microbacterium testaceum StLB037]|uniref:Restriction endonuclease type IV Mrr domain-containing protein n=1 Tax=Microbacterium testaceum (strain StLB037) TaxID=979556 RepID=E8NEK0_MICTS|nr:hypothetical protein [Microbacterium testaceum]BAJ75085.1 hypothetical protein MTES_2121 [Microbacterium testaceum StLB037]
MQSANLVWDRAWTHDRPDSVQIDRYHLETGVAMIILGATADDKGAQLEALVASIFLSQGYSSIRRNLVTAGGNEIDVSAIRESPVLSHTQSTPMMCEAKAYASPLSMPTWHKFLGKLHLARAENSSTIGILVALNGVNGNVAGSYAQLAKTDTAVFVIEGRDVSDGAIARRELSDASAVRDALANRLGRVPVDLDVTYYAGAYYWAARWDDGSYSVFTGQGESLITQQLAALTPALLASLSGNLVGSETEEAELEARHAIRVSLLDDLFHDRTPAMGDDPALDEEVQALEKEPFCAGVGSQLRLLPPGELDHKAVSRLFVALFEQKTSVLQLGFIADRLHEPYVDRLVDVLPMIQHGFALNDEDTATLRAIAPFFPSMWVFLSVPYPLITTHREESSDDVSPEISASDSNNFWSEVIRIVKAEYVNPSLRGLLYDHLGLAELATQTELVVKTKSGVAGVIKSVVRDAVRQMDFAEFGGEGITHVSIRMLPHVPEPWEDEHPDPAHPLGRSA